MACGQRFASSRLPRSLRELLKGGPQKEFHVQNFETNMLSVSPAP
jgi:hypothetical protein